MIFFFFSFSSTNRKAEELSYPREDISHPRCSAVWSCISRCWRTSSVTPRPGWGCHSSSGIATAKANSLFSVCCRTSQSSLFGSTETLSLRGDNVNNILPRFAMKTYWHLLSGSCPSFLTPWLLGDSSVLLSGTVCQLCANNLGWQLWRSKFIPHFCYILPVT